MNKLLALILFAGVCVGLVSASATDEQPQNAVAVAAVKQFERDFGDALVAGDTDKLDQILADDWVTVGMSGKVYTKESVLADVRAGRDKLNWFELGPMDVQVFGDVAIGQGSVTEKRMLDGKESNGQFVFTDLLQKREGQWRVVRSAAAPVN
jgi:ketosteroid isomerase-like protein